MKLLRDTGHFAAVVERWNPFANVRQDLFGWVDIVAVHPKIPGILGVQTTTYKNLSARLAKAAGNEALVAWVLAAGRLEAHGWVKRKGHWQCEKRAITVEHLTQSRGAIDLHREAST